MGHQAGIARFTGTVGDLNCYFDGDMALARMKSSFSYEKWRTMPSMAAQREATKGFGAASVIASRLWGELPAGMRRLAPGGFNRLVGACRGLVGGSEQAIVESETWDANQRAVLWDVDLLQRLELGGMGGMENGKLKMENGGVGSANCLRELRPRDSVSVHGTSFRLVGMDGLLGEIEAVTGGFGGGGKASKYVVAHGKGADEVVCKGIKGDGGAMLPWKAGKKQGSGSARMQAVPVRRVRAWVHACRVVDAVWDSHSGRYVAAGPGWSAGFVTDWLALEGGIAAARYRVEAANGGELGLQSLFKGGGFSPLAGRDMVGAGEYVVFTAVEVAEKRVRHWVRLPWCNSLRVAAVHVLEEPVAVAGDRVMKARLMACEGPEAESDGLGIAVQEKWHVHNESVADVQVMAWDAFHGERLSVVVMLDMLGMQMAETEVMAGGP